MPGLIAVALLFPLGSDMASAASVAQSEVPDLEAEILVRQPEQEAPAAEDEVPPADAEAINGVADIADTSVNPEGNPAGMNSAEINPEAGSLPEGEEPLTVVTDPSSPYGLDGKRVFNPDPTRAVWLSALFPGLGQIYNRRYWKLPIIVAGYMGLGYGTSWNARMYQDYQRAYADIMDDDPDTKSYLDFFPPTVDESTLDKTWLTQTLKSRKDYYRRNRDLCIICCVGLYLLSMLDAYVDASLTHFDVSDDISLDVAPSILINPGNRRPTPALNWALTF